jgi:hypothetical protein
MSEPVFTVVALQTAGTQRVEMAAKSVAVIVFLVPYEAKNLPRK